MAAPLSELLLAENRMRKPVAIARLDPFENAREGYTSAGNICISGTVTQLGNFAIYRIVSATS